MIPSPIARAVSRGLLYAAVLAALRLAPLERFDTLLLLLFAAALALPIAAHRMEYRLFARRAVLERGLASDTRVRRWLWRASLLKLAVFVRALGLAFLILLVSVGLNDAEWLVLVGAALALTLLEALVEGPAGRRTRGEFTPVFLRTLLWWPLLAGIVAACTALFIGAAWPVYSGQDIAFLVETVFQREAAGYVSPLFGYGRGLLVAADTVSLYLAQSYIPRLQDNALQWSLWLYLAAKSAFATGLVAYLLLGLMCLAALRDRSGWRLLGKTLFEKSFMLTLLALFAAYLYLANVQLSPDQGSSRLPPADCEAARVALEAAQSERLRDLSQAEQQLASDVRRQLREGLDRVYATADQGVERYLDWHYSVIGEYQQLGAQLSPALAAQAMDRYRDTIGGDLDRGVAELLAQLQAGILAQLNDSSASAPILPVAELPYRECFPTLELAPPTLAANPVYVGHPQTVAGGAAITALVAKKTAAKLTAKSAGKAAGKWGASLVTGVSAGSLCGPLAPLCGTAAAIVTWLGVDAIIVTADEMVNREELGDDIRAGLAAQREAVEAELAPLLAQAVSAGFDRLEESFRIPEHGVGD